MYSFYAEFLTLFLFLGKTDAAFSAIGVKNK